MTKKILLVFGTRPEAIKMAPLVKLLQAQPAFNVKVCVTAQHRQMLDQVLHLFDIQPDFDLNLMKPGQDLYDITSGVLLGLKPVLAQWQPDAVLVHGDTSTTFAASLAAFYQRIPVGHVEAGLRTGNLYSPWPEEANRKLTSALAQWHFAPTATSRSNLLHEGVASEKIHVTGNTVIDALLQVREKIVTDAFMRQQFEKDFSFLDPAKRLVLVTGHRRENFGEGFENICQALAHIAKTHADVQVVYPVHLNPQVQEPVKRLRQFMFEQGWWDEHQEQALLAEASREVDRAVAVYESTAPQAPETLLDYQFAELPREYRAQRLRIIAKGMQQRGGETHHE